jgi:hypothetical protein
MAADGNRAAHAQRYAAKRGGEWTLRWTMYLCPPCWAKHAEASKSTWRLSRQLARPVCQAASKQAMQLLLMQASYAADIDSSNSPSIHGLLPSPPGSLVPRPASVSHARATQATRRWSVLSGVELNRVAEHREPCLGCAGSSDHTALRS